MHVNRDRLLLLVAGLTFGLVLALVIQRSQRLPEGPQGIVYDHEACHHCHMLISDPAYAAQVVTTDGEIFDFDDPGCALRYLAEAHPSVHRLWFHHARDDRWLTGDEAGFQPGAQTPMGYGLAVVDAGTPGALDLAAATRLVVAHGGPPEASR